MRRHPRPRLSAFTLIEVLAAVFLTAVVMTIAITFFIGISDSTDAAAAKARDGRRALAVIDRVARDLEASYLRTAREEVDPLTHPWYFVSASAEGESAADRIHFISRNHRPRSTQGHGSDLALVTWLLRPADGAPGYELLRAVEPGIPSTPPGDFLSSADERFMVVAENIDHFGLRFRGEEGEWVDEWDSSQLERSGLLPLAAEIEISYLPEHLEDDDFGAFEEPLRETAETMRYARHVIIPMRPINVDEMLANAQDAATQEAREGEVDTTEGDLEGDDGPGKDGGDG